LLAPGYEQPFLLDLTQPGGLHLEVNGNAQVFLRDHLYFGEKIQHTVTTNEIIFMGLGEKDGQRDDYKGVDVKGKVVLVFEEDNGRVARSAVPDNAFFTGFTRKVTAATAAGASVVLYATPNTQALVREYEHFLSSPRMELKGDKKERPARTGAQALIIDHKLAQAILLKGGIRWKKVDKAARAPGLALPCPFVLALRPHVDVLQAGVDTLAEELWIAEQLAVGDHPIEQAALGRVLERGDEHRRHRRFAARQDDAVVPHVDEVIDHRPHLFFGEVDARGRVAAEPAVLQTVSRELEISQVRHGLLGLGSGRGRGRRGGSACKQRLGLGLAFFGAALALRLDHRQRILGHRTRRVEARRHADPARRGGTGGARIGSAQRQP
jgi:hypothetical protein